MITHEDEGESQRKPKVHTENTEEEEEKNEHHQERENQEEVTGNKNERKCRKWGAKRHSLKCLKMCKNLFLSLSLFPPLWVGKCEETAAGISCLFPLFGSSSCFLSSPRTPSP